MASRIEMLWLKMKKIFVLFFSIIHSIDSTSFSRSRRLSWSTFYFLPHQRSRRCLDGQGENPLSLMELLWNFGTDANEPRLSLPLPPSKGSVFLLKLRLYLDSTKLSVPFKSESSCRSPVSTCFLLRSQDWGITLLERSLSDIDLSLCLCDWWSSFL